MDLHVEVKPDQNNTIAITDYTREFDEYVPEDADDILMHYYNFKYSQTCTIDLVKYVSTEGDELINAYYNTHDSELDQVRIPLTKDGYYTVTHLVIPTVQWYNMYKNEDLSEYLNGIYVTDGVNVFKVIGGALYRTDVIELDSINPSHTTISRASANVFLIDNLKKCYERIAHKLLDEYLKSCKLCKDIDSQLRLKRDILWMAINVICYHLEWDQFYDAQLVLERLSGCNSLCKDVNIPTNKIGGDCGCKH